MVLLGRMNMESMVIEAMVNQILNPELYKELAQAILDDKE
jgi:hypothetical protein